DRRGHRGDRDHDVGDALTTDHLASIDAALREVAPPGLAVGARRVGHDDWHYLTDSERRAVAHASAARRAEFGAGRALARDLIGRGDIDLPSMSNGAVAWPTGIVGSLSH